MDLITLCRFPGDKHNLISNKIQNVHSQLKIFTVTPAYILSKNCSSLKKLTHGA